MGRICPDDEDSIKTPLPSEPPFTTLALGGMHQILYVPSTVFKT